MPSPRLLRVIKGILAVAVLSLFLFVGSASAGSITLTMTSTNTTVTEGNSLTLDYLVTNNSGASISIGFLAVGSSGFAGDFADGITGQIPNFGDCGGAISDGGTCTFSFTFFTDSLTDGLPENADFSTDMQIVEILDGSQNVLASTSNQVTVLDPGASTPEPSSLLLLGTGLLGLGPFIRRRFARPNSH